MNKKFFPCQQFVAIELIKNILLLTTLICFPVNPTHHSFDNDVDTEHGPASKKRKTASVIVDQPAESDKMVVDQVTDVSATFEEVWYYFILIYTLK